MCLEGCIRLKAWSKTGVTPVLMHWSYCSLAHSHYHQYSFCKIRTVPNGEINQWEFSSFGLTHNWVTISSDNGLAPNRCQAIAWTNDYFNSSRADRTKLNGIDSLRGKSQIAATVIFTTGPRHYNWSQNLGRIPMHPEPTITWLPGASFTHRDMGMDK